MRRVGRVAVWVVVVAVLGGAVWWAVGEWRANGRIAAAKAALDADDPAAARQHLDAVLPTRADSAEVQFLAAQANRRTGDFAAAQKHLAKAKALDWVAEAIDLETALIQAQNGQLSREYDYYLRKCLKDNHPDARLIAEVLVPLDFSQFRMVDAAENATVWTEKQPTSARAWAFLGGSLQRLRQRAEATAAFQKAVDLDPHDRSALLHLGMLLVEGKRPSAAYAARLADFIAANPDDGEALTVLAECRALAGDLPAALNLLDQATARQPTYAAAHQARGRFAMEEGRPEEALVSLRRAEALDPSDPTTLLTLFRCLQQTGPLEAAAAMEKRWNACLADLNLLTETTKKILESPFDPNSRLLAGEICLRNNRTVDGLKWLESALAVQPTHAATHAALARHYGAAGDAGRAEYHRRQAEPATIPRK